jgi:hypothetical protein
MGAKIVDNQEGNYTTEYPVHDLAGIREAKGVAVNVEILSCSRVLKSTRIY